MGYDRFSSPADKTVTLAHVAALVTREAVALCEAATMGRSSASRTLQRAQRQAREVQRAVDGPLHGAAREQAAAWALQVAAVALTEARREILDPGRAR